MKKNSLQNTKYLYFILLIAVSIYCYLIKYQARKKHLLPFYVTKNELKELMYLKLVPTNDSKEVIKRYGKM